ncbi:MAG: hypothetical protein B6D46_02360 [Polyangiaceae bacterium UTPRO1]|jgi:hypothetical protein|nr:hypothetical protein [Myxococcales bacterium]OQY68964.1 MAG: hypothetical protein B6D46_02360 [Polyangiaceae bacterium UTPRO1]
MHVRVVRVVASLIVLTLPLHGCSFLVGSTQAVSVAASDPVAEILVDGKSIGVGAGTVELRRDRSHAFMARTADGRSATATVGTTISGVGIFDIVAGCFDLVNLLGIMAPGFRMLEAEGVSLSLPPANSPPDTPEAPPPRARD